MKIFFFLIMFLFSKEGHLSTHLEEIKLDRMVMQTESIYLVEEVSEKQAPLSRSYKNLPYELPVRKFRVIGDLKKSKTHPEFITAFSEIDWKNAELQIEYHISKLSKFPIFQSPETRVRADKDEKIKILFVGKDPKSEMYIHPWNWFFVSEKYSDEIRTLLK